MTTPPRTTDPSAPPSPPPAPVPDAPELAGRVRPADPSALPRARTRRAWWAIGLAILVALAGWAWQARAGVEATFATQDRYLAEAERAFEAIPLLTDAEVALLRRSRNARHVALAESLGVDPPDTRAEAESLATAGALVRIATGPNYTVLPAESSVPYLTPAAAASLDSIATRFQDRLATKGLPPFRFSVSSGLRSAEDQAALRGGNVNAASGRSSHEYATTYDITYNPTRYSPAPEALPPPPRIDPRVPGLLEERVRAAVVVRQREILDRLAADYPTRLTAALGRALIDLEDEGLIAVVRERRQPVYHITAATR